MSHTYLLCLRRGGALVGRQPFRAADAMSARYIAAAIFDACSDACDSFELWEDAYRIDVRLAVIEANTLSKDRQEEMIRTEEAILKGGWQVAASERLHAQFRDLTNGHKPL